MLFWQFHLIMQVTANVFITAIHGLHGDTSAVQLQKVPLHHPLRHGLSCPSCTVRMTGWSEWTLPLWLYVSRPFYNKSIICFNKLRVNMCEENDFLKALMPCRGRKIIISPAGSCTKYWNHISNFCFHLELLWVDGHMFYFQLLFYFFFFLLMWWFSEILNRRAVSWCYFCHVSSYPESIHISWGKQGRTILQVGPLKCRHSWKGGGF